MARSEQPNPDHNDGHQAPHELDALIDELSFESVDQVLRDARSAVRHDYRRTLTIHIIQPDGRATSVEGRLRDLSEGGVGFVFNGSQPVNGRCAIDLPRRFGGCETVTGAIIYCRAVADQAFSAGVQFDRPIAVDQFIVLTDAA